jgi:hypothetical protein
VFKGLNFIVIMLLLMQHSHFLHVCLLVVCSNLIYEQITNCFIGGSAGITELSNI